MSAISLTGIPVEEPFPEPEPGPIPAALGDLWTKEDSFEKQLKAAGIFLAQPINPRSVSGLDREILERLTSNPMLWRLAGQVNDLLAILESACYKIDLNTQIPERVELALKGRDWSNWIQEQGEDSLRSGLESGMRSNAEAGNLIIQSRLHEIRFLLGRLGLREAIS